MSRTKLAIITFLSRGDERPDNTLPGGPPPRPDQGLPGGQGGHPSHPIVLPDDPDVIWPPQVPPGGPGPDNTLPTPPPGIPVHLPVFPPVGPDNSLPGSQPRPDQGLPKPQPKPDNTLPDSGARFELKWSPVYGWVLVPVKDETAQPKRR